MKKIKDFILSHKELILYLIFGVLTTLVNFVAYAVSELILTKELYLVSNIIAWVIAVVFAYVTNKLFVFESKSWVPSVLAKEIPEFVGARIFSLLVEEAGLLLLVDVIGLSKFETVILGFTLAGTLIAKIILAVIVVIMNYFFSKFIIFKKESKAEKNTEETEEKTEE